MRIHIVGASGSGTTTLGAALAQELGVKHFDVDDYYWLPTDPPFSTKRSPEERVRLIQADVEGLYGWVLSGSLVSWGGALVPLFDLVVFLQIPNDVRLERLRARELARYGADALTPGSPHYEQSKAFLEWASAYHAGDFRGRSLPVHLEWLDSLACPVIRLVGNLTTEERVTAVLEASGL